jgi:hypothetical protein
MNRRAAGARPPGPRAGCDRVVDRHGLQDGHQLVVAVGAEPRRRARKRLTFEGTRHPDTPTARRGASAHRASPSVVVDIPSSPHLRESHGTSPGRARARARASPPTRRGAGEPAGLSRSAGKQRRVESDGGRRDVEVSARAEVDARQSSAAAAGRWDPTDPPEVLRRVLRRCANAASISANEARVVLGVRGASSRRVTRTMTLSTLGTGWNTARGIARSIRGRACSASLRSPRRRAVAGPGAQRSPTSRWTITNRSTIAGSSSAWTTSGVATL